MKRRVGVISLIGLLLAPSLIAKDYYWYLASAFIKPGKVISQQFNQQQTDRLYIISGSCGQLLNKIEATRRGGIFTPSSEKFFEIAKDKNLVRKSHRLLVQTPVLGLSKTGEEKIRVFDDIWNKKVRLTVGNPTMTLGKTFSRLEKKMSSAQKVKVLANIKSEALTVNQIVSYLSLGVVDGGLIFDSLAKVNRLKYIPIPKTYNIKEEQAYLIQLNLEADESGLDKVGSYILSQKKVFLNYGFKG